MVDRPDYHAQPLQRSRAFVVMRRRLRVVHPLENCSGTRAALLRPLRQTGLYGLLLDLSGWQSLGTRERSRPPASVRSNRADRSRRPARLRCREASLHVKVQVAHTDRRCPLFSSCLHPLSVRSKRGSGAPSSRPGRVWHVV